MWSPARTTFVLSPANTSGISVSDSRACRETELDWENGNETNTHLSGLIDKDVREVSARKPHERENTRGTEGCHDNTILLQLGEGGESWSSVFKSLRERVCVHV